MLREKSEGSKVEDLIAMGVNKLKNLNLAKKKSWEDLSYLLN